MGNDWHWMWIKRRIEENWEEWTTAAKKLSKVRSSGRFVHVKKILVAPGVLTGTEFARPESIKAGGPLGELVQWADLIAAIHLLGHNVTLHWDITKANEWLVQNLNVTGERHCSGAVDIIFTDYIGLGQLSSEMTQAYKFKLRVLDVYGTEAEFNVKSYARKHRFRSLFSSDLHLQQFLTLYPTTPDNSFLGFMVSSDKTVSTEKDTSGVVYGKEIKYLKDNKEFLSILSKYVKLHFTMPASVEQHLPVNSRNHGVVASSNYQTIMQRAKLFIGLGEPLEGPGALESLARGCIFINPMFKGERQKILRGKPTQRLMSSQVPYLEDHIGPPHVLTVDRDNLTEVEHVVKTALKTRVHPFIPHEFTAEGFLLRLNFYLTYQTFCGPTGHSPLTKSFQMFAAEKGKSCNSECENRGLVCEPSLFHNINNHAALSRKNIKCNKVKIEESVFHPSYGYNNTCYFQNNELLFSCAAQHAGLSRLCPCRNFIKYQIAL